MNKKTKKLTLNRDTVQALENTGLIAALGGAAPDPRSFIDTCPSQRTCPTLGKTLCC